MQRTSRSHRDSQTPGRCRIRAMTIPSPLRPCDRPCSHRRSCAIEKARERMDGEYRTFVPSRHIWIQVHQVPCLQHNCRLSTLVLNKISHLSVADGGCLQKCHKNEIPGSFLSTSGNHECSLPAERHEGYAWAARC